MSTRFLIALAAMAAILSGCAFGTRRSGGEFVEYCHRH